MESGPSPWDGKTVLNLISNVFFIILLLHICKFLKIYYFAVYNERALDVFINNFVLKFTYKYILY